MKQLNTLQKTLLVGVTIGVVDYVAGEMKRQKTVKELSIKAFKKAQEFNQLVEIMNRVEEKAITDGRSLFVYTQLEIKAYELLAEAKALNKEIVELGGKPIFEVSR